MDKSNIMKLVTSEDEIILGDYVLSLTIDEVSVIALIYVKGG